MRRILVIGLLAIWSAAVPAGAATCTPRLLGADRRGPAFAVARAGSTVYLGVGAALEVVDVADPAHPRLRSWLNLESVVRDLAVSESIVVVLGEFGLSFVDAADPDDPLLVGSFAFPSGLEVMSVAVAGSTAYYVPVPSEPWRAGLRIVDFSAPAQPRQVGFHHLPDSWDVAAAGGRAFVSAQGFVVVLDVTRPDHVFERARVEHATGYLSLSRSGERLAVYGGGCGRWDCGWASMFDVSRPDAPVRLDGHSFLNYVADVAFAPDRLYLVEETGDGHIYDSAGSPLGGFSLADPRQLAAAPGFLYAADRDRGLRVFAVADPAGAHEVAARTGPGAARGGYLRGRWAITAHHAGLRVFDLAQPGRPALAAGADTGELVLSDVDPMGTFAYASSYGGAIRIFDLADPRQPMPAGEFGGPIGGRVLTAGELAFSTTFTGTRIYDAADPLDPRLVGNIGAGTSSNIAVSGERLYDWIGVGDDVELQLWNLADPRFPRLEAQRGDFAEQASVAAGDRVTYVGGDRLRILDVGDLQHWRELGSLPVADAATLATYGSLAVVGAPADSEWWEWWPNPGRLVFVDVSRPAAPRRLAAVPLPVPPSAIAIGPGLALVADGIAGIAVVATCAPFADGFERGGFGAWSRVLR